VEYELSDRQLPSESEYETLLSVKIYVSTYQIYSARFMEKKTIGVKSGRTPKYVVKEIWIYSLVNS
jgi:hypothetical protein